MSEISDRDHAELLMLYAVTSEDIERTKHWMWRVAYVTLAGEGGVLWMYKLLPSPSIAGKVVCFSLLIALVLIAWQSIQHAQAGLAGFRIRIRNVRQKLGESFNVCFGQPNPKKEWSLHFVVGAGALTSAFVLWLL